MKTNKDNTMLKTKLVTSLIVSAFLLQSCSKTVPPTTGASTVNSGTSQSDIATTVNQTVCAMEGDVDTDGDGICDKSDTGTNAAGQPCSTDPYCINGKDGVSDEYANASKSKWWLYAGLPALGIAGTMVSKAITGDYWWNQLFSKSDTSDTAIFQFATDIDNKVAGDGTETWANDGTKVYNEVMITFHGSHGYDFSAVGGDKFKKGEDIAFCIRGIWGNDAPVVSGTTGINVTGKVAIGSDYQKLAPVTIPKSDFKTFCDNHIGAFIAFEDGGVNYWIKAVPSTLMNSLQANTADATVLAIYHFPNGFSSSASPIQYTRQNIYDTKYETITHESTLTGTAKTQYDAASDAAGKAKVFFDSVSGIGANIAKTNVTAQAANNSSVSSSLVAAGQGGTALTYTTGEGDDISQQELDCVNSGKVWVTVNGQDECQNPH